MFAFTGYRPMMLLLVVASLMAHVAPVIADDDADQAAKDALIVETIQKIDNFDITKSEKAQAALSRYLKRNHGSQEYVDLIERFHVDGEAADLADLADLAVEKPRETIGVKAAKLVIDFGQGQRLIDIAAGDDAKRADAARTAMGLTGEKAAVEALMAMACDMKHPQAVRSAAVQAIGLSRNGELALLEAVKDKKLPADLNLSAGQVLSASADPAVRDEAGKLITMPTSASATPLPPVSELVKLTGDVAKGKMVFERICVACHKVADKGIDFGPNLTEIGDKLPKEGLYSAILDPSAGISFGFEGFTITFKDGTQAIGLIASETEDNLTLRLPGGIMQTYPKANIASRQMLPTSFMPPGLQAAMTQDELVGLVEYLTTLKKAK